MHRRRFLLLAALGAVTAPRLLHARLAHRDHCDHLARLAGKHPDPRPGVTAELVLADDHVGEKSKKAYAAAREFPEILDGLYCHCDCGERDGMRSLLSCFESKMPQSCGICRGEAEMAGRLAREGKTLAEIRTAVDERWG